MEPIDEDPALRFRPKALHAGAPRTRQPEASSGRPPADRNWGTTQHQARAAARCEQRQCRGPEASSQVQWRYKLGAVFANQLASETEQCAARQVAAYSLGEPGVPKMSVFDEPECFERLNPELVDLEAPSFLEWVVALVGSPVFLSEYPQ